MSIDLKANPILPSSDWTKERLVEIYSQFEKLNETKYKYNVFPSQIEIVPYNSMIDNHTTHGGMPILYKHWSFGKSHVQFLNKYKHGQTGLAYEMVTNSNPCVGYLMEENTEVMQALTISHAFFGHNNIFKNNYLHTEWTDAEEILDYLEFSKNYIADCEEKYGEEEVSRLLDACHMLQWGSFTRYKRSRKFSAKDEKKRQIERYKDYQSTYNEIWGTIPSTKKNKENKSTYVSKFGLPEENILYFLEKYSPNLTEWQREIIRIVRNIGQYFYPNIQTNTLHEGCACFTHYHMMYDFYDKGFIHDGAMIEWLKTHAAVVFQPSFEQKFGFGHFNPYALGFAMCQDIYRMAIEPTQEDKKWFPDIAGKPDYIETLKHIWQNYRDESFVRQFLSPKLIRDFRMFSVLDNSTKNEWKITNIHDSEGYTKIRNVLADSYLLDNHIPLVEVADVDIYGDRVLTLQHKSHNGHRLAPYYTQRVIEALSNVWGYPVILNDLYTFTGSEYSKIRVESYEAEPSKPFSDR
jgi:stage V sporulation protein R